MSSASELTGSLAPAVETTAAEAELLDGVCAGSHESRLRSAGENVNPSRLPGGRHSGCRWGGQVVGVKSSGRMSHFER
ncbi:MAG: hypothetical protein RML57_10200 [Acidobacteriota bacterium]|nr:hypothetical protein [Acidobacteriota bacterium]